MDSEVDVDGSRAAGIVAGTACGDALGAGYEFGPPLADGTPVAMVGGGVFDWAPGEWTDDTSMAVPVLQAVAAGRPLTDDATLDGIVAAWVGWARDAQDVGAQTRAVLGRLRAPSGTADGLAADCRTAAAALHAETGRTAGNGSLMRTAPVVLAHLDGSSSPEELAVSARAVSDLTHADPEAGDACVLWCAAVRHAVLAGEFDLRGGLALLPARRQDLWAGRIDVAEVSRPRDFPQNGWVVQALQAAWSAIVTTPVPTADPASHFRLALEDAVRGGNDTDTVAAIAGGLLGARWGAGAVPPAWRELLHGWPGSRLADLERLTQQATLRPLRADS
ncbi:ADP-ribosylglycohydrolase family protein [Kineococcus sp. GCM10028916]|uniref:ADP-ribosylglycohydrolase family protein n=1 Tax=Kineococcus sp. GCM10028916 TaxID=3273394 RepID=UPI00362C818F